MESNVVAIKTTLIRVKRKRFISNGDQTILTTEKKTIKVTIEKGVEDGQIIRFKGEADEEED